MAIFGGSRFGYDRFDLDTPTGGGTAYSLSCSAGSYAYTGVSAGTKAARKLTSAAGSYAYTGVAAGLVWGKKISAAAGSYSYTGVAATTTAARKLTAAAGSYTYTGVAATLTYVHSGHQDYTLACSPGSYLVTGNSATLTTTSASQAIGGGNPFSMRRPRTREEIFEERERLGITPKTRKIIAKTAAKFAQQPVMPAADKEEALKRQISAQNLAYQQFYATLLLRQEDLQRQRLITQGLSDAKDREVVRQQALDRQAQQDFDDDEDDVLALLLSVI